MKQLITSIRNQPQHYKNRIVLFALIGVGVFLLILWLVVGMPPQEGSSSEVVNDFSQNVEENKDALPDLFPKE
jgi:hypothetical protein